MNRITTVLLAFLVSAGLVAANAQERSQGISVHMLPKRVAEVGGRPWGFTVDYSPHLKTESYPVALQTVAEVLSFVRKQDAGVQENGLWIVTTSPDAYSADEKRLLEEVKSMCRREKIPLFICRASQLPDGWLRLDPWIWTDHRQPGGYQRNFRIADNTDTALQWVHSPVCDNCDEALTGERWFQVFA